MSIRRATPSDERRRRVLRDESEPSEPAAPTAGGGEHAQPKTRAKKHATSYSSAALENQPRVTDLIPVRPWTLWVLGLLGATVIATLETLHSQSRLNPGIFAAGELQSVRLDARDTLAGWFASLILAASAAGAALIFSIRRHKLTDYRGRYRVWLWVAIVLILASMDATAGVHQLLPPLMSQLSGRPLLTDARIGWLLFGGALFAVLGFRLFLELRASRGATTFLALAAVGYMIAAACHGGWPIPSEPLLSEMLAGAASQVGHLMLFMMVTTYARRVLLEAKGKLRGKQRRAEARKHAAKANAATEKETAMEQASSNGTQDSRPAQTPVVSPTKSADPGRGVHAGSGSVAGKPPIPAASTLASAKATSRPMVDDDDDDEDDDNSQLSRAERRRLKKIQRQERQAA